MDDDARERLSANIKAVGLLEPIIVNETTGNVLSGHQRIEVLDNLEGSTDYALDVAVIALTLEDEQAQNIFLNNELAMGDWDAVKLGNVLRDVDPIATGFKPIEIETIVPGWEPPQSMTPPAKTPELDNSVILIFKNRQENDDFMKLLGLSEFEKYMAGETLAELVRIALTHG